MTKPAADRANPRVAAARQALEHPLDFGEFLAKLTPKDRLNAERRIQVLEAEPIPGRADLWRRLVCVMMTLAPHAAKFVGKQTVQFYVADGKYRRQMYAMEDLQDGQFTVYCPDVLKEVLDAGLVAPAPDAGPYGYRAAVSRQPLRIEPLDGSSVNPAAHFKDMTGWNRKAVRITLPPGAEEGQVRAVEMLCAVAAQHFIPSPPPPRPAGKG
jgi:hypothetical protein